MLFKRMNKRNLISTVVLVAIFLTLSYLMGTNKEIKGIADVVNLVFIFSIAALSLNIVCGCLGEFVLGHAGFVLIGYTLAVLIMKEIRGAFDPTFFSENVFTVRGGVLHPLGYGLIVGDVILAAIITGIFGFIVGVIVLGRLKGDYLAIVTLGISLIFVNICNNFDDTAIINLGGGSGINVTTFISGTPIIYASFLVLVVILILAFMKTRFGRSILACRDDNIAAEACGVAVNKTKILAFTFSSIIAGLAGGLFAFYSAAAPSSFGQDRSIFFLVIIVLGGLGSLTGSIFATGVLVFYEFWLCKQTFIPEFFRTNPRIIYGIVLVLIMLFRPNGILGTSEFTWKWFYSGIKKIINKIFKKKTIAPKEVE